MIPSLPATQMFYQRVQAELRRICALFAADKLDERNPPASLVEDLNPQSETYGQTVPRVESVWCVSHADYATGRRAQIAVQCRPELAARNAVANKSHVALRSSVEDCAAVATNLKIQAESKIFHDNADAKLKKGAHVTLIGLPGGE